MMKLTQLFCLAFSFTCAFGQTHIDELEKINGRWTQKGHKKPFSGKFLETFENGALKGTGNFEEGLLTGQRLRFYPNGNKASDKEYKESHPNGRATEFFEDGSIRQTGVFKDGKEEGLWSVFYPDGKTQAVICYEKGVQHGLYKQYDQEGRLVRELFFRRGEQGLSDEFMLAFNEALQIRSPKCISLYDKAIEINPTVAQAYFNRAVWKAMQWKFEEAIEDYNKAIWLNPNYAEAYANRGNEKMNLARNRAASGAGQWRPSIEESNSICEDLNKAMGLGDKSELVNDLSEMFCKPNKE